MEIENDREYDSAIIGGGPAGLMAGIRGGELGLKTIILEKNKKPGIKLLTTGGGRCNFTNYIADPKILAAYYHPNKKFLISAFSVFGADETIDFFNQLGVTTKIEDNNRVFPASGRAQEILDALIRRAKENKVEIRTEAAVKDIIIKKGKIEKISLHNGEVINAKKYIIATGGKSYPLTGSSGDAYNWLEKLGHTIIKPRPALAPIYVSENFISKLEGLSLKDIKASLFLGEKKIAEEKGDIIFTKNGVSGPIILNLSRFIDIKMTSMAGKEKYKLEIDLFPDKSAESLMEDWQEIFHGGHKFSRNVLEIITKPKLAPVLISLLKINPEKQANGITKEERIKLVKILKRFTLSVIGLGNFNQAMITAGGVDLKEVDPKTMRSKIISNLYFAGEILDLSGPTGGFNLQLCWSTGHIAGKGK